MATAHLILFIRVEYVPLTAPRNDVVLSVGIFSERQPTLPYDVAAAEVLIAYGDTYGQAREALYRNLREYAHNAGGVWEWLLDKVDEREIEPHYDFTKGVRGKYAGRFRVDAPVRFISDIDSTTPSAEVSMDGGKTYLRVPTTPASPTGFVRCSKCGFYASASSMIQPTKCAHDWQPCEEPK